MRKITYTLILCAFAFGLQAQEFAAKISEAKSAYNSGNLENTRFALQQAMSELDMVIGQEVLALLPETIGGLAINSEDDNSTGSGLGFSGVYVHRNYGDDAGEEASIDLITDSPLMAGITAILAMPTFLGGTDNNQKTIKIDGYKSLLQKNDTGYDIQIPLQNSLLTFHYSGTKSESDVISMVNNLPVTKIAQLIQ